MPEEFIYIMSAENGKFYNLDHRSSAEEFIKDLDSMRKIGYKMEKLFKVPTELFEQSYGECVKFIDGKLSLEDLEKRVDSLQK